MRLFCIVAAMLMGLIAAPAFAQVPTTDAERLTQETGIANCMQKAREASEQTVSPTKGIQGSVATPGSAGPAAQIGSSDVTGSSFANIGAQGGAGGGNWIGDGTSGSAVYAGSATIGGQDLTPLFQVANSIGSLKGNNFGQVLAATAAIANALQQNKGTLEGFASQIGSANGIQAGFDQNSAVRVGSAAIWNQAVQVGNTTLMIRNQQLEEQTAVTSATQKAMEFDASKAAFVKVTAQKADNSIVQTQGTTTYDAVAQALDQLQSTAGAPTVTATGSINGQ